MHLICALLAGAVLYLAVWRLTLPIEAELPVVRLSAASAPLRLCAQTLGVAASVLAATIVLFPANADAGTAALWSLTTVCAACGSALSFSVFRQATQR